MVCTCDPQSHYKTALAGMSLVDVANMTESETKEKVPIYGHHKRLVAFNPHTHMHTRARARAERAAANLRPLTAAQVMALQALGPIAGERAEAASASASASPWSPQVKFNSTSSLYIDSTITRQP